MISTSSFSALKNHLYPDGIKHRGSDFGLECWNARHAVAEKVALEGYVSSKFPDSVTGFEIAVMEQDVRDALSHHELPSTENEIAAFDSYMPIIGVPASFGTEWHELIPHIQQYSSHAWSAPSGNQRRAYTSDDGLFTVWRFTNNKLRSLQICVISIVQELQREEPCDDEELDDEELDDEELDDEEPGDEEPGDPNSDAEVEEEPAPLGSFEELCKFRSEGLKLEHITSGE